MKTLKTIGITLLVLVAILIVIGFFLPSKVHVERTATIKSNIETTFNQVNTLKNWEQWSPWHVLDPKMKLTYGGAAAGVTGFYAWESDAKNVGCGKLTITDVKENEHIGTLIEFKDAGEANSGFNFVKAADATKVTWYIDFDMGMNPIARYFGLFMDSMMGKELEKGLEELNKSSQAAAQNPSDIQNN